MRRFFVFVFRLLASVVAVFVGFAGDGGEGFCEA